MSQMCPIYTCIAPLFLKSNYSTEDYINPLIQYTRPKPHPTSPQLLLLKQQIPSAAGGQASEIHLKHCIAMPFNMQYCFNYMAL